MHKRYYEIFDAARPVDAVGLIVFLAEVEQQEPVQNEPQS